MFTEDLRCDCFGLYYFSTSTIRWRRWQKCHNIETVFRGCEGAGAGVKACTEMLSMAAFATPELSRMCYIAGHVLFPGFP